MAKKSQKAAAAQARAQRLAQISRKIASTPKVTMDSDALADSDSDCQYVGGVNHNHEDSSDDEDWIDSEPDCLDNTFDTLKANMPKALASVRLSTI